jgi:hypothetical protein
MTGLAAWASAAGGRALLVGQTKVTPAGSISSTLAVLEVPSKTGGAAFSVTAVEGAGLDGSEIGPVAVADVDGDGDLDVFVGGRLIPGRYPEPSSSVIFRNESGALKRDEAGDLLLANVGLVSGAMWSDLDGDGFPELVLACEWGPLKIFRNHRGRLTPWDPPVTTTSRVPAGAKRETLAGFAGWWNSVAAGDFDGDGRLDLVAGNWGLNSSYHDPSPERPLEIFYGDFDGNGTIDLLETEWDEAGSRVAPRRGLSLLSAGWPALRTRFASHRMFATADVRDVLGAQYEKAQSVQANTLASMVFLNRGDHFEAARLPDEAQLAPAFGINVADFDGDGFEDLFVSQNFFSTRPEEPRLDAGRGLVLRGDGAGRFKPVSGAESGVQIYGEQRGSAVGDFDGDGRIDLAVAQHGGPTRLFRNATAKPGLRVRLKGPAGNPDGLGAAITLVSGEKRGPVREVRGGSGYWSQDSVVSVMSLPASPAQLIVGWPGGQLTTNVVPAKGRTIVVDQVGSQESR